MTDDSEQWTVIPAQPGWFVQWLSSKDDYYSEVIAWRISPYGRIEAIGSPDSCGTREPVEPCEDVHFFRATGETELSLDADPERARTLCPLCPQLKEWEIVDAHKADDKILLSLSADGLAVPLAFQLPPEGLTEEELAKWPDMEPVRELAAICKAIGVEPGNLKSLGGRKFIGRLGKGNHFKHLRKI